MNRYTRWLKSLILLLLILGAGFSLVDAVFDTFRPTGGIDIFTYWALNMHSLSGSDPFAAFLTAEPLPLPFQHVNGWTTALDPASAHPSSLLPLPTGLPLLVTLLLPLSLFTWPVAKVIFLVVNLGLLFTIPWITWAVLRPTGMAISRWSQWSLALLFYGLLASRNNFSNGQQSMLILWAALLGLLLMARGYEVGAGILLGIAFSKYTLAFPFLLFLLYKRRWKVLTAALGTQVLGGLVMAALIPVSPFRLARSFLEIFRLSTGMFSDSGWGVGFSDFFPDPVTTTLVIGSTLLTGFLLYRFLRRKSASSLFDVHVLAILAMWSLTIVHHGYYDVVSVVIPLVIGFIVLEHPTLWALRPVEYTILSVLLAVSAVVLLLPGESFGRFVPVVGAQWGMLTRLGGLFVIVLAQYGVIWLMGRLVPVEA